MERAKRFYRTVFDAKLEKLDGSDLGMWAFPMSMEAAGAAGALVKMPCVPSGPGGTMVYFNCADCAEQSARAASAGGTCLVRRCRSGSMASSPW